MLKFLATLPKIHLFFQTKKMLAYQTNSNSLVRNETNAIEKPQKTLRAASLSAGIGSYQSLDLTLGTNKASGSQTAGKFPFLSER